MPRLYLPKSRIQFDISIQTFPFPFRLIGTSHSEEAKPGSSPLLPPRLPLPSLPRLSSCHHHPPHGSLRLEVNPFASTSQPPPPAPPAPDRSTLPPGGLCLWVPPPQRQAWKPSALPTPADASRVHGTASLGGPRQRLLNPSMRSRPSSRVRCASVARATDRLPRGRGASPPTRNAATPPTCPLAPPTTRFAEAARAPTLPFPLVSPAPGVTFPPPLPASGRSGLRAAVFAAEGR